MVNNGENQIVLVTGNNEGETVVSFLTSNQALLLAGALQGHALLLKQLPEITV